MADIYGGLVICSAGIPRRVWTRNRSAVRQDQTQRIVIGPREDLDLRPRRVPRAELATDRSRGGSIRPSRRRPLLGSDDRSSGDQHGHRFQRPRGRSTTRSGCDWIDATTEFERVHSSRYRVIQWATGAVGTHALRALLDDPQFELVGVYVHSPDKVGRDAGELAGLPIDIGIKATNDAEVLRNTTA